MRIFAFLLYCLFAVTKAQSHQTTFQLGPQFHYMKIDFMQPSHIEGYAAGIKTSTGYRHKHFQTDLDFEGTWNAGPVAGYPAERSSIYEYFLTLRVGGAILWRCWEFAPYTGVGWDRFSNKQNPQGAALSFRYDKLFLPVGLAINWMKDTLQIEWRWAFRPDVLQNLRVFNMNLDLRWGYAFQTSLLIKQIFPFSWGHFSMNIIPFFDWNRFGSAREENSTGILLVIPRLIVWKVGVRALIGVTF